MVAATWEKAKPVCGHMPDPGWERVSSCRLRQAGMGDWRGWQERVFQVWGGLWRQVEGALVGGSGLGGVGPAVALQAESQPPSLAHPQAAWICTRKTAGADLSIPIGVTGAWNGVRGKISSCSKLPPSLQLPFAEYSTGHLALFQPKSGLLPKYIFAAYCIRNP